MGFVFSFAWTPCVGPALGSVLLMAASASSKAMGFMLIGVYTLGFVVPFLAAGLFTTALLELFKKHKNAVRYTVKIGGIMLILMGVMMLTGGMNRLTGYLSSAGGAGGGTTTATTTTQTGAAGTSTAPKKEEVPAVDFELFDQFGQKHSLEQYRGKVIFLNFWATWCPPCRAEMPDIQRLYEKYSADPSQNVVVLGVAAPGYGNEKNEQGVRDFLSENGYTYPVVMDTGGRLFTEYYITGIPTTFMIDENGNIFGYVSGAIGYDIMENIIDQTKKGR